MSVSSNAFNPSSHSFLVKVKKSLLLYKLFQTWPYIAASLRNNLWIRLLCFAISVEVDNVAIAVGIVVVDEVAV